MSHSVSKVSKARFIVLGAAGALLAAIAAIAVVVYSGLYNVAADIPHTKPVFWLIETMRERSVAVRATDLAVPGDLDNADRIVSGAGQYADMCAGCHLAPGMKRTEMSRGLYPRAPELRRGSDLSPAEEFWVVKHGIKATGMPAWGVTHSDEMLWDVVAFLRKLPELSPEQYQALVKEAPTHDEIMQDQPKQKMEADDGHGGHAH
ncbi:MAG: c-type cytochrome [Methyloceanibacter sp.]|uniref:c-type cytochrome n=1 Tax=Methyloceanibacter sp. TaxID=1965321 RepID=UPI003D6C9331